MKQRSSLRHEFVDNIPEELADHTMYISIPFATVVHKCCCGCGNEIVTPLSPTDWTLSFDGDSISLDPSIGSWSLDCRSHYWIERNAIRWAGSWSPERIQAGRMSDRSAKDRLYQEKANLSEEATLSAPEGDSAPQGIWRRFLAWWNKTIR